MAFPPSRSKGRSRWPASRDVLRRTTRTRSEPRRRRAPDGALDAGELGLWLGQDPFTDNVFATLSASERKRAQRLRAPAERTAFAASHAVMSHAVRSQDPGLSVVQHCVRCGGEHGRPQVRTADGRRSGWHVSLARSRPIFAVALAQSPVGVDVERIDDAASAPFDVILTSHERAALAFCSPARRGCLAARLWCLKEALGKALGTGLEYAEQWDVLDVVSKRQATWASWRGWAVLSFSCPPNHAGALAIRSTPPVINGHWVLPAGGHEISPAVATRFSQRWPREFPGHDQMKLRG